MQKKRTKPGWTKLGRLLTAVAAVLLLFVTAAPNAQVRADLSGKESGNDVRIVDTAQLLGDTEEQMLYDEIKDLSQYGNIIFYSEKKVSGSTDSYIKNWYNSQYGSSSGTVFFIDMQNRQIYIFSNGHNYSVITKTVADNITDRTWTYARNEAYYLCASESFKLIGTVLNGGKIAMPMRYISNGLFALGLAMLICYWIAAARSKAQRSSNKELLTYVDRQFQYTRPTLTYTHTKKI